MDSELRFKVNDKVYVKGKIVRIDSTDPNAHVGVNVKAADLPPNAELLRYGATWASPEDIYRIDELYNDEVIKEVWELAKKIMLPVDSGGWDYFDRLKVFGDIPLETLIHKMNPVNIFQTYKEYKQQYKPGAEVKCNDGRIGVILHHTDSGNLVYLKDATTETFADDKLELTGHFGDMTSLFSGNWR